MQDIAGQSRQHAAREYKDNQKGRITRPLPTRRSESGQFPDCQRPVGGTHPISGRVALTTDRSAKALLQTRDLKPDTLLECVHSL